MSSYVSASAAFGAGLLNFFASCLLPLVPLYLAHLGQAGYGADVAAERTRRVRLGSVGFVLSFSVLFVLLGVGSQQLFSLVKEHTDLLQVVAGVLLLLATIPLVPIMSPLLRERRLLPIRQLTHPLVNGLYLGLVVGASWTPCLGPVLGAILTLAGLQESRSVAVVLLSFYSAGLAAPFLLIAFLGEAVGRRIRPPRYVAEIGRWLLIAVLVFEAILLLTGRFDIVAAWFGQFIRIGSV